MKITINGCAYNFSSDVLSHADKAQGYFALAKGIFGLDFKAWQDSGFWDDTFIPYVLFEGDRAVSSAAVCVNDVAFKGEVKRYVQLSTVMTLPEYRGKGLNRWLMTMILDQWRNQCDAVYLLGNDSVAEYYPRYGFSEYKEYDFVLPVHSAQGEYRKLDLSHKEDRELLVGMYEKGNPFAALTVNNIGQFMFHCLQFQSDNIYYVPKYDLVAIAEHDGDTLLLYDAFTHNDCSLQDIASILARDVTAKVQLGFTPRCTQGVTVKPSEEEDNHLFVLQGKENVFAQNRVLFPLLSRA